MEMVNLIIYFLLCYGICNTIIFANGPFHIFKKMHEYLSESHPIINEMLTCFICLPYWCGFFMSALNILLFPYVPFTPMNMLLAYDCLWPVIIFFDGAITSGGCWLIHTFQEMMERIDNG